MRVGTPYGSGRAGRDKQSDSRSCPQSPAVRPGRVRPCALSSAVECEVTYLTGRPERCRKDTVAWLARHGLPEGRLRMRRNDDRRPARRTKLEILERLGREREVRVLVDDDELVCDAAELAGFTVVRARWARTSPAMEDAQEREGRT
ncbi:hypothetical protein [Streptomyces sp. NPDC048462]|uniref:LNS2 domain-containing protein n=1 Tax=Streptomyces sp. NPDC048462 TaxID=3365555 RepID=UPI003718710F